MVDIDLEEEELQVKLPVKIKAETNVVMPGDVKITIKTRTEEYIDQKPKVTINEKTVYFTAKDIAKKREKEGELQGDGFAWGIITYEPY